MKTPEEYVQEKVIPPDEALGSGGMTEAERAFLQKYVGLECDGFLAGVRRVDTPEAAPGFPPLAPPAPAPAPAAKPLSQLTCPPEVAPPTPVAAPAQVRVAPPPPSVSAGSAAAAPVAPAEPREEPLPEPLPVAARTSAPAMASPELATEPEFDEGLRHEAELQLVSFHVGKQEFALPITVIQEVIRFIEPTKLPTAPEYMAGIINLRGRVTPLVSLRTMLQTADTGEAERFIIVCRHRGLQIGLIVTSVKTMYRAAQERIEWAVEARVGVQANYLAGLLKSESGLINILSVDRLVARIIAK